MSRIPNVSLSNGVLMPAAVFGVYQIRDLNALPIQCDRYNSRFTDATVD